MRRAALVTGGAKRIGKEICVYLADRGYDIALHYNCSHEKAKTLSLQLKKLGVGCRLFKADLSTPKTSEALISKVFKQFPHCCVLVNNASVFKDKEFADITLKDFEQDMAINFTSPFFLTQQFSKHKSASDIINLIDTRVSKTNSSYFTYNITKHCLYKFTQMAAKKLAPKIRVNGICPGDILPLEGLDESYLKKRSKRLPLKRVGSVDNVISALDYLLSNEFVTGQCLFVDGGEHLL
ncbi:MAG: SDR family oxidoreductase [Candidatus Dadabacteria bacterium]|nr:SDR family oxidoreductase [Candidatus Dadabacteria bacterium]NIS09561.1 SDR family oxidoreductase [Candidatus Dadabacteria bacterium]NIV43070.1 SDR family oxidoreductase [Candidatus Dadabacteria bacterium]NIX16035.1 SDR family oxidoreductase [Candidatus Dadabacteria bacterium]NIY22738.1 SDR family oxidoreductase [Candidatus Dadabacteria bacterium]